MKIKQLLPIALVLCSTYCFSQKKYLVKYTTIDLESVYSYNANDQLEKENRVTKAPDTKTRDEYIYNKENLCERLDNYQELNGKWTKVGYIEYFYDTNRNKTKRMNYNINLKDGTFILGAAMNYTYDENSNLTKVETCMVEDENENPYDRIIYTYEKNLLISSYSESRSPYDSDAEWILNAKGGNSYDTEGRLVVDSLLNVYEGEISLLTKKEYLYDKNGNLTNFNYYIPGKTNPWFLQISHSYEYDLSLSAKEYILPVYSDDYGRAILLTMNNERTKENYYSRDNNTGEMGLVKTYTYEYQLSSGITSNNVSNNLLCIYPNPVETSFLVNSTTKDAPLYIYDIQGRLVVSYNNANSTIEVPNLSSGVYFVKCGNQSVKMIKK